MTERDFFLELERATNLSEAQEALARFEEAHGRDAQWVPFGGRWNNRGIIEIAADPGRSLVERITNAIDAILELEFDLHHGTPECRSPKEAASAWLGLPTGGLSEMSPVERRALAQRATVRVLAGDGRDSRTVEIRDRGIGLSIEDMPRTILSLNESNKVQKHYLAGIYGQGGSSTFAVSKLTFIASRRDEGSPVGFTVVRYEDLPPENYRTGNYVNLVLNARPLEADIPPRTYPPGTIVKHFGYDLSGYPSPLGPNSVYGLLNRVLFDPVVPVWLDNPVNNQRRVIKGSRNALNGAVDEGDEERRGPRLSHNVRLFYVGLGDFGQIGFEYWVLERPTSENKKPTAAFLNPARPVVLTLNGQNHAELSASLVRKDAELPYLTQRLIFHADCNHLTAAAKRSLFVSTREDVRRGIVLDLIQQEIIRALKSDDELRRLNEEARARSLEREDEDAVRHMRSEVARLLRIYGMELTAPVGAATGDIVSVERPAHPRIPRPRPQPIELHEPPTYVRLVWEEDKPINFYPEQRRYLRVESDANSNYHTPDDPTESKMNFISTNPGITLRGSTPLQGGRMRAIFECAAAATVGTGGTIRVELSRPGLPTLSDERSAAVVDSPPIRPDARRIQMPPFDVRPVDGPEDEMWTTLGWPDDVADVASGAITENGQLVVYYSTVYPAYVNQLSAYESRDPVLARSFTERYKIWLAVHSLLLHRDQQTEVAERQANQEDVEAAEAKERAERRRAATLAVFFARNEVQYEMVRPQVE